MKKIINSALIFLMINMLMPLAVYADSEFVNVQENNQAEIVQPEIDPSIYIEVFKTNIELKSKLNTKFAGYKFSIKNNYNYSLNILDTKVINGVSGETAYYIVEKDISKARMALGVAQIPFTFGLSSLNIAEGLINKKNNDIAKEESVGFTNPAAALILQPGYQITFNTLIPREERPMIKLTLQDLKTKQIYTILR